MDKVYCSWCGAKIDRGWKKMKYYKRVCKHCLGISENEIGETIAFCEGWDAWKNVTCGDCFWNCEWQEREEQDG